MATLRDMITRIGFRVDEAAARQAESRTRRMSLRMKVAFASIATVVISLGTLAVKAAGDMEMMTTQFEVMLGSAEKAVALMEELKSFAAGTPFALEDLANGSQQLLSFGVAQEDVIKTMRMLGDTAGGNAEKLGGLVLAYGKVTTKGKASLEEINMMAERGLPIFNVLSEGLGVTKTQLFKLISAGKISAKEITKAFQTMTSEGGLFFEGMKKQSLTFQGLISTMKDNMKLLLADVGSTLLPLIKEVVTTITELIQGPLGDLLSSLIKSLLPVIQLISDLLDPVITAILPLADLIETLIPTITALLGVVKSIEPLLGLVGTILTMVNDVFKELLPTINDVIVLLLELLDVFLQMITADILELLKPLTLLLKDFAVTFGALLQMAIPLLRIFMWALSLVLKITLGLTTAVVTLFAKISGKLTPVIVMFSTKLIPILEKVEFVFGIIIKVINNLTKVFVFFVKIAIDKIKTLASFIFTNLIIPIGKGIQQIIAWLLTIGGHAKNIVFFIGGLFSKLWDFILGKFPDLGKSIGGIGGVFKSMWEKVGAIFTNIWDGIVDSIMTMIGWINKIPGVDLSIPSLTGGDNDSPDSDGPGKALQDFMIGSSPEFNPAITPAGGSTNVDMQNNISISVPPGTNTEGIKTAVQDAARAIFTIELQKILIDTGN